MRRINFGFRTNDEERQMITTIAQRLERSESDCVRLILRNVAREMGIALPPYQTHPSDVGNVRVGEVAGTRAG